MLLLTMVSATLVLYVSYIRASHNSDTIHSLSTQNDECIDTCDKRDTEYYWCHTNTGHSRYCSLDPNTDYYGRKCIDACRVDGLHGNASYCNVDGGKWGYCSRRHKRPSKIHYVSNYRIARKNNRRDVCNSTCEKSGSTNSGSGYRCSTKHGAWDYCSPEEETNSFGSRCYVNAFCTSNAGTSYDCCYDGSSWQYYGRVENVVDNSAVTTSNAATYPFINSKVNARENRPVENFIVNNVTQAKKVKKRAIRRNVDYATDTHQEMVRIIDRFSRDTEVWSRIEPSRIEENPILFSFRRQISPGVSRVELVLAFIRLRHYKNVGDRRVNFPRSYRQHMINYLGAQPEDEAGHLVAASFSGPPEYYNLVPQHRSVNRNVGVLTHWRTNEWFAVENRMRKFFKRGNPGNRDGYILWYVAMYYRDLTSGRPYKFRYVAWFYDECSRELSDQDWFPLAGESFNALYQEDDEL